MPGSEAAPGAVRKNNTALHTTFPGAQIPGSPARNPCPEGFPGSSLTSGCLEPTPPARPCHTRAATHDKGPSLRPAWQLPWLLPGPSLQKSPCAVTDDSCERFLHAHSERAGRERRNSSRTEQPGEKDAQPTCAFRRRLYAPIYLN